MELDTGRVRRKVYDQTLRFAAGIGQGQRVAEFVSEHVRPLDFEVDPEIREFTPEGGYLNGAVILPLTQGQDGVLSYSYCILAHAFRERGYEPIIPLCDADLPICILKESRPDHLGTCTRCNHYGRTLLDAFGLEATPISSIVPSRPDSGHAVGAQADEAYKGIDIQKYAIATTRRFLKKRLIDFDDDKERALVRRFAQSGVAIVDACEALLTAHDVQAVVAHHPMYIYGGLYLEVAHQHGVPAHSVAPGYNNQTLIFGNKRHVNAIPQFNDPRLVEDHLRTPLTLSQQEEVDEVVIGREEGSGVRVHPAARASGTPSFPEDVETVGLFTNLMWDASLEAGEVVFSSVYSWVMTTIEYLAGTGTHLVIKPHPAESLRGTQDGIADWIKQNYDPIPGHVTLLEADTDIDPYSLIQSLDAGIVYNSTLGLEMAYRGVPVIVVGETHYRGFGFTHDPADVRAYLELLDHLETLEMSDAAQKRAQRYAHFLFLQTQIPFPYYDQHDLAVELLPVAREDLKDGQPTFDRLIKQLTNDEAVYLERSSPSPEVIPNH